MSPETHLFFKNEAFILESTFYRSATATKEQTIIYLHGGGLIWGDRNDLPVEYIQQFLDNGYHFLAIDYPLAPETPLPEIYACTVRAVEWFCENFNDVLHLTSNDYSLFGRSAGAYLALLLGNDHTLPCQPKRIISFYGYHSIQEPFYLSPSKQYQKYPAIPESMIKQMIQKKPLVSGPLETRYAIYIYCRQTGKWLDMVMPAKSNRESFSLSDDELKQLPPTFIAQSKNDQDVPYVIGVHLANTIPHADFFSVENLDHDFDKDSRNPVALQAYEAVIEWLHS